MTPPATAHHQHPPPSKDTDVTLAPETLAFMEQRMAAAVEAGIKGAITEETAAAFWSAGLRVLQKQASEHTGRFVIGGLWGLARKAGTFLALGGIVYAIGGWTALAKLWQVVWSSGSAA